MSAVLDSHAHGHDDHHEHHGPTGWRRWVFATNHKDIGTLYLLFAFTMLMIGGVLALIIRAELFNQLTTMHGVIMVFGAIMPAFVGFANWMIPLQIGAPDMAFARMNNFSFWLMIPAGLMLVGSFISVMPGARMFRMVTMMLIEPIIDDAPMMCIAKMPASIDGPICRVSGA